jgi:predicted nucleotidyltransferase
MGIDAVLQRRRKWQRAMLARARGFVATLDPSLSIHAAVVFGSVARGDFNRWSDIDVLVVADGFRGGPLVRMDALEPRPPLVQPVGWTPSEWRVQLVRNNPIAREALEHGIWLSGSARSLADLEPQ